jgi:hypothetical protein
VLREPRWGFPVTWGSRWSIRSPMALRSPPRGTRRTASRAGGRIR